MPSGSVFDDIKTVFDEINQLRKKFETKGELAKAYLQTLKIDEIGKTEGLIKDGVIKDEAAELDEATQKRLLEALTKVRDKLWEQIYGNGPDDPGHLMYDEFASNMAIRIMVVAGIIAICLLIYGILNFWDAATRGCPPQAVKSEQAGGTNDIKQNDTGNAAQTGSQPAAGDTDKATAAQEKNTGADNVVTEKSILLMVMLLGALGGMLQYLSSISKYIGNRQLKRSWIVYYMTMPFIGAGLAPVTYLLLRIGVLSTGTASATGGSTASYMNLNGIYAFAVLTGMFAKAATAKLSEVFQTLFNTREPPTKDPLDAAKKVGA